MLDVRTERKARLHEKLLKKAVKEIESIDEVNYLRESEKLFRYFDLIVRKYEENSTDEYLKSSFKNLLCRCLMLYKNYTDSKVLYSYSKEDDQMVEEEIVFDFEGYVDELNKTYILKNKDYGNSFENSLDTFGIVASLVRISDKLSRLNNLLGKEDERLVLDESIQDTISDSINYIVMTLMWLSSKKD